MGIKIILYITMVTTSNPRNPLPPKLCWTYENKNNDIITKLWKINTISFTADAYLNKENTDSRETWKEVWSIESSGFEFSLAQKVLKGAENKV